jgi:hypothetical protein
LGSCGCSARAAIAYADVRPKVALSAIPVERIRAERAGCLSRRTRLVVIVFTRFVVFVVVTVVIVLVLAA